MDIHSLPYHAEHFSSQGKQKSWQRASFFFFFLPSNQTKKRKDEDKQKKTNGGCTNIWITLHQFSVRHSFNQPVSQSQMGEVGHAQNKLHQWVTAASINQSIWQVIHTSTPSFMEIICKPTVEHEMHLQGTYPSLPQFALLSCCVKEKGFFFFLRQAFLTNDWREWWTVPSWRNAT